MKANNVGLNSSQFSVLSSSFFSDSLPDGWGQLLLNRALSSRGILLSQISRMDRLAYVGLGGMGALIYRPEIDPEYDSRKKLELDSIALQVNHVLEGTSSDVIEELLTLGGTSEGKLFAFEFKWNPKARYRFPGTFLDNYPYHETPIINPDNYEGFLGVG